MDKRKNTVSSRVLSLSKFQDVCSDDFEKVHCDKRTLQRNLKTLHEQRLLHIVKWRTRGEPGPYLPLFRRGTGKDKPYPERPTHVEKQQRRRLNPDVVEREAALKRLRRRKANPKPLSLAGLLLGRTRKGASDAV
jgi:hypothetical protein